MIHKFYEPYVIKDEGLVPTPSVNADTKRSLFGVLGVSDDTKRCVFR